MGTLAVTGNIWGLLNSEGQRTILVPPYSQWQNIDAAAARAKGEDRIAPHDLEKRIAQFEAGLDVVLLSGENGQLRFGCSMAVVDQYGRPLFGLFDKGHKLRPGAASPAAGIYPGGHTLIEEAISELGEEIIPRRESNRTVGCWRVNGVLVDPSRAKMYAETFGYTLDPDFVIDVQLLTNFPGMTTVYVGEEKNHGPVTFEGDSSGFEMIYLGTATIPDDVDFADGEGWPENGEFHWRGTEVIRYTSEMTDIPLTEKAEIVAKTVRLMSWPANAS